jgi:hypothetical protein
MNFDWINREFVDNILDTLANGTGTKIMDLARKSDFKQSYFVGATLCIDTVDEFGMTDVITINYSTECFGSFSGKGVRRLLSIQGLQNLKRLMELSDINHREKSWM